MKSQLLLIGDSIRDGYQPEVSKILADDFTVWGPADNCRFAKYTLNELDRLFTAYGRNPDIIHWNNGLWDSAIVCQEDGMFTPPDEYERYIRLILRELRKRCDKIIFATTTPVLPIAANQKPEFVQRLNMQIVPVMQQEGVTVNDLYTLIHGCEKQYICEDGIHLTDAGKQICGQAVANTVHKINVNR